MDAENERVISEGEHQRMTTLYATVQQEVSEHYKENKRSIAKSKYAVLHLANFRYKSLTNISIIPYQILLHNIQSNMCNRLTPALMVL